MLDEFIIIDILQGGLVFHSDDLFEISMDDLSLRGRLHLAKLLGELRFNPTRPSIKYVEVILLEAVLKIFNKNFAFFPIALELRGYESGGLLRFNFDWICVL